MLNPFNAGFAEGAFSVIDNNNLIFHRKAKSTWQVKPPNYD
jgi:hypothetical protein